MGADAPSARPVPRAGPSLPVPTAGLAVLLACLSSGLLFAARGAYMPYFFPLYEGVSRLDYASVAILLNIYLGSNALCSPFVGLLVDRWSPRRTAVAGIAVNACTLVVTLVAPTFVALAVSVALLGATFTMGRVAFNAVLITNSDAANLRRAVSIRAMLMTGGSLLGNIVAASLAERGAAGWQIALVYAVMSAAWVLAIIPNGRRPPVATAPSKPWSNLPTALRNRPFRADLLRLFVALLPYGCWGTIIPKYVLDAFANTSYVPTMYAVSTATIVGLTYAFNQGLSAWCHRRGFPRQRWTYLAMGFFIAGLVLIGAADGLLLLVIGAAAFGLGEVMFTPCMDEAVQRNSAAHTSGTYIGVVQLTEGGARLVGSTLATTAYGLWLPDSGHPTFWLVLSATFAAVLLVALPLIRSLDDRRKLA